MECRRRRQLAPEAGEGERRVKFSPYRLSLPLVCQKGHTLNTTHRQNNGCLCAIAMAQTGQLDNWEGIASLCLFVCLFVLRRVHCSQSLSPSLAPSRTLLLLSIRHVQNTKPTSFAWQMSRSTGAMRSKH